MEIVYLLGVYAVFIRQNIGTEKRAFLTARTRAEAIEQGLKEIF